MVCFYGCLPVFQQEEKDLKSFRMFTSQLVVNGTVRQRDIVGAFQAPLASSRHRGGGGRVFSPIKAASRFRRNRFSAAVARWGRAGG